MLQYMTSCQGRRKDYEEVSWLELLTGGENPKLVFSDSFKKAIDEWPEALVALSASDADARTQGTVSAQLLIDNLKSGEFRDATLNGPTNVAWLNPWRRYLEAQGVEFIHGEFTGFTVGNVDGEERVWPEVKCYEPRHPGALDGKPALMAGYFVLALPVTEAWKAARSYVRAVSGKPALGRNEDLLRLARFPLVEPRPALEDSSADKDEKAIHDAVGKPTLDGELRHMVGIQYYFAEDLKWIKGHVSYPDADFRISSISQARFWADKHDWEHGHRGVLSVIVSKLDPPAWDENNGRPRTPSLVRDSGFVTGSKLA